jgi:ABC-type transport system involved in cytochrome c biogenesis permease component
MTVLPIVDRELRVAARRRNTYWIRVVMASVAIVIVAWILLSEQFQSTQSLGQVMFTALSGFALVYCLLAGLRATADCLSEEKRNGTLGLLFLTDLKGYDIVLGKLAATSLNALGGLVAMLPVMAVPLLAGSVAAAEVGRVALVALNTLFFSLAAGMFASAVSREERRAMGLCFIILAVTTVGLPALGALIADRQNMSEPPFFFLAPSPGFTCILAFEDTYRSLPHKTWFTASLLTVHGMAWAFLGLSCLIAPRAWQDKAAAPGYRRFRDGWRRFVSDSPGARARFRDATLSANPFYWLLARDRTKPALVWVFLIISAALWSWGWGEHRRDWLSEEIYVFTGLALNSVLKVWVASEACWRFSTDRNSGALELVLATPLKVKEIIGGQIAALLRQFAAPVAVVLVVEVFFMQTQSGDGSSVLLWVAGMAMLAADLVTLSWVGMWLGLRSRHQSHAIGGAIGLVLVLPWLLFAFSATVIFLTQRYGRSGWEEQSFTLLWLFIGLMIDLIAGLWARSQLHERFRSAVTERFVSARGKA